MYFNFSIIPMFFNKHQTTTIIFVNQITKKMYLYILNTGLDIQENGPEEIINGQKLYQLCKGICICENLDNDDELLKGWHILYNFFYISYFYNYIESHSYSEKKIIEKYKFNSEFKNKLLYFDYIFNEKFSSIKIFNNTSTEKDLTINELIQIIDSGKLFNEKNFLNFKENYYSFVSKFIDINNKVAVGKIIDISNLNYTSIEKLDKKFSENFLKKIILYNQNDNLYIHAQESASCTWNSIYFSMLFLQFLDDYDWYIQLINFINFKFNDYLQSIYNYDNFQLEFKKKEEKNSYKSYHYMLKLCSKLIDVKILDRNLLHELQDIVYNTNLQIEYFESDEDKNIYTYYDKNFYDENNLKIITNIINLEASEENITQFYLTAYRIYTNKKDIFFKIHLNTVSILEELQLYIESTRNFEGNNEGNYVFKIISNYIQVFENTYKLTSNMIDYPSYITYFIPIILYINNNNNFNSPLPLDFNENKNNLFECCLIFFRLYIVLKIINFCYNCTNNDEQFTNLIDKSIIKLIFINFESKLQLNKKEYNNRIHFDEDIFNQRLFKRIDYNLNKSIGIFNIIENDGILESFNEKFDIFLKNEKLLLDNFNLITREFLKYNMYRINKDQTLVTKLIKYYCKLIYENQTDNYSYLYIIIFGVDYFGIKNCKIDINFFNDVINNLKKKLSYEDFETKILNERKKLFDEFSIIPNYNYEKITIDDKEFEIKNCQSSLFEGNILLEKK